MSAVRPLLVGFGNEQRGDDAAGLLVARRLAPELPAGWRVAESGGDGAALVDLLADADRALLVDAVAAAPGEAGRILRLDASREPLPAAPFAATSTHALGIPAALELARALGKLPADVVVYGVGARAFAPGTGPGSGVLRGVEVAAARILAELGVLRAGAPCRAGPTSPGSRT